MILPIDPRRTYHEKRGNIVIWGFRPSLEGVLHIRRVVFFIVIPFPAWYITHEAHDYAVLIDFHGVLYYLVLGPGWLIFGLE
jgi:hypothetical protein